MKYWTIQNRKILNILNTEHVYYPDIEKSDYLQKFKKVNEELFEDNRSLYCFITQCSNKINFCNYPGIIFCFFKSQENMIMPISDEQDFYNLLNEKRNVIQSLWKTLSNPDSILLELEFQYEFWNPLFIDINDYQYLMPPVVTMPPYQEGDFEKIQQNLMLGICRPKFASGIIQGHLPFINIDMIQNVYELRFMN